MRHILCFGDSNTWGLIPGTQERYPWEQRWTGLLQSRLSDRQVRVIEEGLCGRTAASEDPDRPGRNGAAVLPVLLESQRPIDAAVLMLGTNDCKPVYGLTPAQITRDVEKCVDILLTAIPAERLLLVSPIHLGDAVWLPENDPAFDPHSVEVSGLLADHYRELAVRKGCRYLAASDWAQPSERDREHMTPEGHRAFAGAVSAAVNAMLAETGA